MSISSTDGNDTTIMLDPEEPDCFTEFYSPPRVCLALRTRGLPAHHSFDLATGYDFLCWEDRARALHLQDALQPLFVMLSPPCTMYSSLQNLNLAKMEPSVRDRRFQDAHCLLDFAMLVAERQIQRGGFFCHEHPARATSWRRASVQRVAQLPGCQTITFDQCRVGLMTPGGQMPLRKRTTLLTNSTAVVNTFGPLQCNCPRGQGVIQGSEGGIRISTYCQVYTPQFVNLLAQCVEAEIEAASE